jgi:hypothetical protein
MGKQEASKKHSYKDLEKTRLYQREYQRNTRQQNLENRRETGRRSEAKFRKEKPDLYMLRAAKKRAKEKGLDFNLSKEDIVIPQNCPILGIPLIKGEKYSNDNSPSLDRVDNNKGYIKDNVIVISQRANMLKSNGSAEEHEAIAKFLKDFNGNKNI